MNELIERIFQDFTVDGSPVPVAFLRYDGRSTTFVTYMQQDADGSYAGDDDILYYVDYYDFHIYSKGNYLQIAEEVKRVLEENGFVWQPSRSSGDMFEDDTGFYHKTLNFAIERSK